MSEGLARVLRGALIVVIVLGLVAGVAAGVYIGTRKLSPKGQAGVVTGAAWYAGAASSSSYRVRIVTGSHGDTFAGFGTTHRGGTASLEGTTTVGKKQTGTQQRIADGALWTLTNPKSGWTRSKPRAHELVATDPRPADYLAPLRALDSSARIIGEGTAQGVSCTRIAFTVDASSVRSLVPPKSSSQATGAASPKPKVKRETKPTDPGSASVEVLVDVTGKPLREVITLVGSGTPAEKTVIEVDFTAFDTAGPIAAPAKAEWATTIAHVKAEKKAAAARRAARIKRARAMNLAERSRFLDKMEKRATEGPDPLTALKHVIAEADGNPALYMTDGETYVLYMGQVPQ